MSAEGRLNLGPPRVLNRRAQYGMADKDRGPLSAEEAKDLHALLDEAIQEDRMMWQIATGARIDEPRRVAERLQAEARHKAEDVKVGPTTPEAWGEVPNDLAGQVMMNGRFKWAHRQMLRRLLSIKRIAIEIVNWPDRVLPAASTSGSPLPDMLSDKAGDGASRYRELQKAQARRRSRGEP